MTLAFFILRFLSSLFFPFITYLLSWAHKPLTGTPLYNFIAHALYHHHQHFVAICAPPLFSLSDTFRLTLSSLSSYLQ